MVFEMLSQEAGYYIFLDVEMVESDQNNSFGLGEGKSTVSWRHRYLSSIW